MNAILLSLFLVSANQIDAAPLPVQDLLNLSQFVHQTDRNWKEYRVLSFSHVPEEDARGYRVATKFAIETLNRKTKEANVTAFGDLWIVNVKNLNWPAQAWDDMSDDWEYYKNMPKKPIDYLSYKMGTKFPIMRADVFVEDCWKPAWYEQFLQLPDNRGKLWQELGMRKDWANWSYLAVTDSSDVAFHGRKFARTRTGDGFAIWVTMGYEDQRGENDVKRFPLNLDCHYNEIAFEAPNGLDVYYMNTGGAESSNMDALPALKSNKSSNMDMDGKDWSIIKNLPTRVATDFKNGGNIVLGNSCIGCHSSGTKQLDEKLLTVKDLDFSAAKWSLSKVNKHFDNEEILELSEKDADRWQRSVKRLTGNDHVVVESAWRKVRKDFNSEVDLAKALSEIGISEEKLREKALQQPYVEPELQKLLDGEFISRIDWEHVYNDVLDMFEYETRLATLSVFGN